MLKTDMEKTNEMKTQMMHERFNLYEDIVLSNGNLLKEKQEQIISHMITMDESKIKPSFYSPNK